MAKGYWIANFDVTDQAKYDAYRAINGEAFRKYGGRFLVRGGQQDIRHGPVKARNVVIEFPSFQAAKDCYASPEYKRALDVRANSVDIAMTIVEGYDGEQP